MSKLRAKRICDGKSQYTNSREAHKALNKVANRSDKDKIPVRTYFCDFCNFWHLTSKVEKWP
jgi:hypothetical protein